MFFTLIFLGQMAFGEIKQLEKIPPEKSGLWRTINTDPKIVGFGANEPQVLEYVNILNDYDKWRQNLTPVMTDVSWLSNYKGLSGFVCTHNGFRSFVYSLKSDWRNTHDQVLEAFEAGYKHAFPTQTTDSHPKIDVLLVGQPEQYGLNSRLQLPEYQNALVTYVAPNTSGSNSVQYAFPSTYIPHELKGRTFDRVVFPVGVLRSICFGPHHYGLATGGLQDFLSEREKSGYNSYDQRIAEHKQMRQDFFTKYPEVKQQLTDVINREKLSYEIIKDMEKEIDGNFYKLSEIEIKDEKARSSLKKMNAEFHAKHDALDAADELEKSLLYDKILEATLKLAWEFVRSNGKLIICENSTDERKIDKQKLEELFKKNGDSYQTIQEKSRPKTQDGFYYNPLMPSVDLGNSYDLTEEKYFTWYEITK